MSATEIDFPAMANTGLELTIPVAHGMGVRILEAGPGHVVGEVPADGNTNHIGSIYAGVLFTAAEILGGAISLSTFDSSRFYPIVKSVEITFKRPAMSVVTATASLDPGTVEQVAAAADEHGKADFVLEAELTDVEGTVVATTRGVYQLRTYGT